MSVHSLAEPGRAQLAPRRPPASRPQHLRPQHLRPQQLRPQHLRVVETEEFGDVRRRRLVRLGGVVAAGLVVAMLFASVGMHVMLAQNQFRIDRLNAQGAAQQDQYQRLRLEVDQLAAPQRIIAAAEGRLGMVQPGTVTFLAPAAATGAASPGLTSTIAPAAVGPGWSALKPQLAAHP